MWIWASESAQGCSNWSTDTCFAAHLPSGCCFSDPFQSVQVMNSFHFPARFIYVHLTTSLDYLYTQQAWPHGRLSDTFHRPLIVPQLHRTVHYHNNMYSKRKHEHRVMSYCYKWKLWQIDSGFLLYVAIRVVYVNMFNEAHSDHACSFPRGIIPLHIAAY